jgi:hypothetical protein
MAKDKSAKDKLATKRNNKAPTKTQLKKTTLSKKKVKKVPAPQHNNSKGSWKRVADDSDDASSGESSGEEPPRPWKKVCGKERADEPDDEVMLVDDDGEDGPKSDSEV